MKEHETVVLMHDLPEHKLEAGDLGAIVHCYSEGVAYEVEFVTFSGQTAALVTLKPSEIRPVAFNEIAHARAVVS
jgi:hypothetical protein